MKPGRSLVLGLILACGWAAGLASLDISRNLDLPAPQAEDVPGFLASLGDKLAPLYQESSLAGEESFSLLSQDGTWTWKLTFRKNQSKRAGEPLFTIDDWETERGVPVQERWNRNGTSPLVARSYDEAGNLITERHFGSGGAVLQTTQSTWDDRRLRSETMSDGNGTVISVRRWFYNDQGFLLDMETIRNDQLSFTHYLWEQGMVREIHHKDANQYRIEIMGSRGQRERLETYRDDALVGLVLYGSDPVNPSILLNELVLDGAGTRAEWRRFSSDGKVIEQVYYLLKSSDLDRWSIADEPTRQALRLSLVLLESWRWNHDAEGRPVLEERWEKGRRQRTETVYTADGFKESTFLNGALVLERIQQGPELTETSHRNGKPVFRTYSRDGKRYREEELDGANVIRTREIT